MKRSEAGSGGKKGHSNMEHWDRHEFVKVAANKTRRGNDKLAIREQI